MRTIALLLSTAACALAVPVTILNPSFETATLSLGFGYANASQINGVNPTNGGTLANWTPLGAANPDYWFGALDPLSNSHPNWTFTWETGNNIAYVQQLSNSAGNIGLTQTLVDTLQPNTAYTLQVDVGRRLFTLPTWNYSVELWAGSTQLASAFSNPGMTANSVALETLSFITGNTHSAMGQALQIRLMTNGARTEAFFDNVRLDATGVPEPSTWALVGLTLLFLRSPLGISMGKAGTKMNKTQS